MKSLPPTRNFRNRHKFESEWYAGRFGQERGKEKKMQKLEQLYEGKAKKVFKTDDPKLYIVDYKDDATAFNGEKKGTDRFKRCRKQ